MKMIDVSEGTIDLGQQGEHLATLVRFPIAALVDTYGEGIFLLFARRPGETATYPVRTYQDDEYLYWNVTGADTAYAGTGRCELQYFVNESLVKSIIYLTIIGASAWVPTPQKPQPPIDYRTNPYRPRPYPPMPPGPPKSRRHDYYREWPYLPPHIHPEVPFAQPFLKHDPAYNPYNQWYDNPAAGWFNDAVIQNTMAQKAMQEASKTSEDAQKAQEDAVTAAQIAKQYQADSERYRDGAALAQLIVKSAQADILQAKDDVEELVQNIPNIIPRYLGEYDAETQYKLNDIVMVDNTLYWHTGATPTTGTAVNDTEVWTPSLTVGLN